jgi:hypothetical protein
VHSALDAEHFCRFGSCCSRHKSKNTNPLSQETMAAKLRCITVVSHHLVLCSWSTIVVPFFGVSLHKFELHIKIQGCELTFRNCSSKVLKEKWVVEQGKELRRTIALIVTLAPKIWNRKARPSDCMTSFRRPVHVPCTIRQYQEQVPV